MKFLEIPTIKEKNKTNNLMDLIDQCINMKLNFEISPKKKDLSFNYIKYYLKCNIKKVTTHFMQISNLSLNEV